MGPRGRRPRLSRWTTAAALIATGCVGPGEEADARDSIGSNAESVPLVVDDAGDTLLTVPVRTRVVSMIPSVTELVLSLGGDDLLVGRTRYDTRPELAHLPSVGGGLDPDMESLLTLRPDLVVLWPDHDLRGVGARLAELGVPTYSAAVEGIADFRRHARNLGALLGRSAETGALLSTLDAGFEQVRASVEGRERPTVAYVVSLDPPTVAGPGTFVDSLVSIAGGRNVFHDLSAVWPQISLEEMVLRDPDLVALSVSGGRGIEALRSAAGWTQVPAVQAGRIGAFDPDRFNRPGPGMARAAFELARWLHPAPSAPPEG